MAACDPPVDETTTHDTLRALLGRLDVDDVVRRMEPSLRRIPAYVRLAEIDEDGSHRQAAVRRHLGLVVHWILTGTPPDDYVWSEFYEQARGHLVTRESVDSGLQIYRRGARIFWDVLLGLASDDERTVLLSRSDAVWGCLDSYVDTVASTYAEAFRDQGELPDAGGDRRARTLFDRLCTTLPVTVEDRERAVRLGFDLDGLHRPFVALLHGASAAGRADLASRLRSSGALAFVEGPRVVGLTGPGFDWSPARRDHRLVLAQESATERGGIAAATDTLRTLVAVASGSGRRGHVRVDDFLPELLLANSPDLSDRLAHRVFGPLKSEGGELTETLNRLAANGFDSTTTAAALHVHRNTLRYRVKQIERVTGLSLQQHGDRELVRLASLWICRVRERAGAEPEAAGPHDAPAAGRDPAPGGDIPRRGRGATGRVADERLRV